MKNVTAFEVLAEPNRRLILDLLRDRERPVKEIVDALDVSQPAVSKHLRVLREAGLVESKVDAQRRLYRLRYEPLREIDEWVKPYRAMWASSLSALEEHLATVEQSSTERDDEIQSGEGKGR
jgi:DNA-binding transcriptional ArsR family regulator